MPVVIAGLGFLILVVVACSPSTLVPTPTLDVPGFADGEAVAVVKTWLSGLTYETVTSRRVCATPTPDPNLGGLQNLARQRDHRLQTCSSVRDTSQHNCLAIHRDFEWASEYLGHGVWAVKAQRGDLMSKWRVFEGSLAVDSVEAIGRCG